MSLLHNAVTEIKARGLNRIRCCLTGAPYATLEDLEIAISLQCEIEEDSNISLERLVDTWELKSLTFNSQALPSLRGVKTKNLVPLLQAGNAGQVKILGYFMTRLFFPHIGSEPMPSDKQMDRMFFAIQLYDAAVEWDGMQVGELVQRLVVIDSYCAMPYWHTLWAFESAFSKLGLAKAPKQVQEVFANPTLIVEDIKRLDAVIQYLYELMIYVTERDGVAGKSGNRLAQQIMLIQAAVLPKIVIPHFQKTLSEADKLRLENKRKMDSRTELRVAYSAIHGKGTPLNHHDNPAWQLAQAMKRDAKKATQAKAEKAKSEPKEKKVTAKIDPRFAAAFNKLVLKQ